MGREEGGTEREREGGGGEGDRKGRGKQSQKERYRDIAKETERKKDNMTETHAEMD